MSGDSSASYYIAFFCLVVAALPAYRLYRHWKVTSGPREITARPPANDERLDGADFARSLLFVLVGVGLAIFAFTPMAARLAQAPQFFPVMMGLLGIWVLGGTALGIRNGRIEPMSRGSSPTYERSSQPRRFWASVAWNSLWGVSFLVMAVWINGDTVTDENEARCMEYSANETIADIREACQQVIRAADEAIQKGPSDGEAYHRRAFAEWITGDTAKALTDYATALRLSPGNSDILVDRGLLYLGTAKFDLAIADFNRAHELSPSEIWPLVNRGIAYAWKGDRARAEADFAVARAIDPKNEVLLRGEALLAENAGDHRLAIAKLDESLKVDPGNRWAIETRERFDRYRRQEDALYGPEPANLVSAPTAPDRSGAANSP